MKQPPIISVDLNGQASLSAIGEAVAALARGALIVLPTETVYGVAADALNPDAERKLSRVKGRSESKPISLLVHDYQQIRRCGGRLGRAERRLAERFWPGPLTLVLKTDRTDSQAACEAPAGDSAVAREHSGYEGFRIPDHPVALAVLRAFGSPLRVTSANLAGEPAALTAMCAMRSLGQCVDLVLDAGRVSGGIASTVVRLDGDGFRVLREGAIGRERIEAAAGTRTR